jgi:hypothetical protein
MIVSWVYLILMVKQDTQETSYLFLINIVHSSSRDTISADISIALSLSFSNMMYIVTVFHSFDVILILTTGFFLFGQQTRALSLSLSLSLYASAICKYWPLRFVCLAVSHLHPYHCCLLLPILQFWLCLKIVQSFLCNSNSNASG